MDKEYCDQMEAKVEAAVMERLIEYPSATYRRIILSIRKWFPDLPIDELKRIMERLVQKESLMVKIGQSVSATSIKTRNLLVTKMTEPFSKLETAQPLRSSAGCRRC